MRHQGRIRSKLPIHTKMQVITVEGSIPHITYSSQNQKNDEVKVDSNSSVNTNNPKHGFWARTLGPHPYGGHRGLGLVA